MTVASADTSLFIAIEQGRVPSAHHCHRATTSEVGTVGELRLGVLSSPDPETGATRLHTLITALDADPLLVDEAVVDAWGLPCGPSCGSEGRMLLNDSWIAATAIAHRLPFATQDDDYDEVPGLEVVKL